MVRRMEEEGRGGFEMVISIVDARSLYKLQAPCNDTFTCCGRTLAPTTQHLKDGRHRGHGWGWDGGRVGYVACRKPGGK